MKLSTRLGIVVLCSVVGLLLIGGVALNALRNSMMEERHGQIENLLKMSTQLVSKYYELEKAGTLPPDEAKAQAARAIMGLQNGDVYLFARNEKNELMAHAKKERVGKVDLGSKMPDGRTTVDVYNDALKQQGEFAYVEILTAKPGAKSEELLPKLNGVTRFTPWNWTIGTGFFVDDINRTFRSYAITLLLIGLAILGVTTGTLNHSVPWHLSPTWRRTRLRCGTDTRHRRRRFEPTDQILCARQHRG